MGRWGQKPPTPQKGELVDTYTLSPTDLEELYSKYGKPGEIAPGVKAERGRDNHRRQQAAQQEEPTPSPPAEVLGDIEATLEDPDEGDERASDDASDEEAAYEEE
jgi:hypothetical protein